ncbi:MAG: FAD-binding oxidoreductase [Ilumatobacter sp.]|uniref:FAD-binding oxidoreductase n=1 Tax=Ilumatobacter sp. TaxID=1967498 RepID=UPI00391914E9
MTDAATIDATPIRKRLAWRDATVVESVTESASARTLVLGIDGWDNHRAGQHLDVRLTAPDGYQATRSYSLSSAPGEAPQITVERVADGEVSPFLVDEIAVGEPIEVRGPIGGYFVWAPSHAPLVLIGGGSGLAPLRSIWRAATDQTCPVVVGASVCGVEQLIYADELRALGARVHLTRHAASGFRTGRFDRDDISEVLAQAASSDASDPVVYVCGPTGFVEHVATLLSEAGVPPGAMRLERFG